MRTSRNLQLYSLILLFLSTFSAAWPWPRWLPELDALIVRQNDNTDSSSSATQTASPAVTKSGSTVTTKAATGSGSTSGTAKVTGTTTKGSTGTNKVTSSKSQVTSYDARLPAGGVSLLEPKIESGSQFYKIGDYVTFAWNYTSLSATPSAVNIMATCTQNQQLYTLAANSTVGNATGSVVWDTAAYQSANQADPLLTDIYTLIIYDAASSISATAQAGYLAVYSQYAFGMYTPQAYTPLNEFKCATCSGALSDMERRALGMVFGVATITVLSFTWFVGGLGVIW